MSVVTLSEEWPRCRESQVICAPFSSARFAKVCLKLWNVLFSRVGPTRGIPGMVHSSAARAGTEAVARVLSVEWGKYDIGLVCVAPGWIDTEGMRQYGDDLDELAKLVPMGRLGTAEEVADTIAFLASPRARYITGQTVVIDGGIDNTHTSAPGITA